MQEGATATEHVPQAKVEVQGGERGRETRKQQKKKGKQSYSKMLKKEQRGNESGEKSPKLVPSTWVDKLVGRCCFVEWVRFQSC